MEIPVRDAAAGTEDTVRPATSTLPAMTTSLAELPSGTKAVHAPLVESQGTFMIEDSWALYKAIGSIVLGLLGYCFIFFFL